MESVENRTEFIRKLRYKGSGLPCKRTCMQRGSVGIKIVNQILKFPSRESACFALEIIKCLYVYEPMLGTPKYSLDKALVSLCDKVFVNEVYEEIERRIKMHILNMEKSGNVEQRNEIDITPEMCYGDMLFDEVLVGYFIIKYRKYGVFYTKVIDLIDRVNPRLRAKAIRGFDGLAQIEAIHGFEAELERLADALKHECHKPVLMQKKNRLFIEDECECVRQNYLLVSCFYDIPETITVPYYDLRKNFRIECFAYIECWNGFVQDNELVGLDGNKDVSLLKTQCFEMCMRRTYDLKLIDEVIVKTVSFERMFLEGYANVVRQKHLIAKAKFKEVLEVIVRLGMACVPEILFHVYDFLSLSHMYCGEYFECIFYLSKGIELAHRHRVGFIATYFLNCRFAAERIAGMSGPAPKVRFDLWRGVHKIEDVILDEGFVRSNRICASVALSNEISSLRELRTIEKFEAFKPSMLLGSIEKALLVFTGYYVISLYCIDRDLYANDFRKIFKVFDDFTSANERINEILSRSRCILKENMNGSVDKGRWWAERMKMDVELGDVLSDVCRGFNEIETGDRVILVLDETTTEFPFESMSIFKSKVVYRVPSLEYFEKWFEMHPKKLTAVDSSERSMFYVLDPDNNLQKTRERISKGLSALGITNGVCGRSLSNKECKTVSEYSTLLYFGHGSGSKHLRIHGDGKNMLLFGCNSARLLCMKNYKRSGFLMKHLSKNSTVMGCLWEVTDKDIDVFSMKVVERLMRGEECLGMLASMFRDEFKMKYLNGASVVVYGLPRRQLLR
ncbi:separase [Ordospora colligata]|nr:separase [Ordospora colligata]